MHRSITRTAWFWLACCATAAQLAQGAEFTAGNVFYTATAADVVVEILPTGQAVKSYGPFANFDAPEDLAFGPDGLLYVAVRGSNRVVKIDASGVVQGAIGVTSGLATPVALAFSADGHLFVTAETLNLVFEFDRAGVLLRTIGQASGLLTPRGLAVTPSGHLFVASTATDRVIEFDASGAKLREIGVGSALDAPERLALSSTGQLYVASSLSSEVLVFDADGTIVDSFGSGSALASPIASVRGPDGRFYVSDDAAPRVVVFDAAGNLAATFTSLSQIPSGLAIAPQRFTAQVTGKVERAGLAAFKVKETVTISVVPGSGFVQIEFVDNPLSVLDVASLFGTTTWAGSGFESDSGTKARFIQTAGVGKYSQDTGITVIAIKLTGKTDATGAFRAKSVAGSIERTREGRSLVATVKSKKALN